MCHASIEQIVNIALGFISALLVDWISRCVVENRVARKNWGLICDEIRRVRHEIEAMRENELHATPYKVPVWRGLVHSGHLAGLAKNRGFVQLTSVYTGIERLAEWEARSFIANVTDSQKRAGEMLIGHVQQERAAVVEEIDQFLEECENGWRNISRSQRGWSGSRAGY